MRERDADLVVDELDEAGAVEAARAGATPDVGDAEVLHGDADDAAVLRGRRRRDDVLGRASPRALTGTASSVTAASEAATRAALAAAAAACCWAANRARAWAARTACRRASSAWSCLISSWIPASLRSRSASWLSIDRFCEARSATTRACAARAAAQALAPVLDLLAERLDVLQHLGVLVADALDHVEPVEQVVQALGAEDDLDRPAAVTVDVERAEPVGDVGLRDAEALAGDDEVAGVGA